jgi:hypothetical protein
VVVVDCDVCASDTGASLSAKGRKSGRAGGAGGHAKLAELVLLYTGTNTISHSQPNDKVSVTGDPANENSITITAGSESGKGGGTAATVTLTNVQVGDEVTIVMDRFPASMELVLTSGTSGAILSTIIFHTSCSKPLLLGDEFGSVQVVGFTTQNGATGSFPVGSTCTDPPSTVDDCFVCGVGGGMHGKSGKGGAGGAGAKLDQLVLEYTGVNTLSHSQPDDKVSVTGDPANENGITISAGTESGHGKGGGASATVILTNVQVGDAVAIDLDRFPASMQLLLTSGTSGAMLSTIIFHTSCSQALSLGDEFGSVRVVGYTSQTGAIGTYSGTTCTTSTPPSSPSNGKSSKSTSNKGGKTSKTGKSSALVGKRGQPAQSDPNNLFATMVMVASAVACLAVLGYHSTTRTDDSYSSYTPDEEIAAQRPILQDQHPNTAYGTLGDTVDNGS